jgi:hypothetical protein
MFFLYAKLSFYNEIEPKNGIFRPLNPRFHNKKSAPTSLFRRFFRAEFPNSCLSKPEFLKSANFEFFVNMGKTMKKGPF